MVKTAFKMQYAANIWPIVAQWAVEHNYDLVTPEEKSRLFVRKCEDSSARINLAISQVETDVSIKAWFSDAIRAELEIDSPSLYSAVPRKQALSEIQNLLVELGYTPSGKAKQKDRQNFAFNLGRSIRKLSNKK